MTKRTVILLLLFVLSSSDSFCSDVVNLEIKIKEIRDENIVCDFLYSFKIDKNDTFSLYFLTLPYKENKELSFNLISNEPNLYFTYGFRTGGNGIGVINSLNKSFDFQVDFTNVILPIKKSSSQENGLIINLNLIPENESFPFNSANCKFLRFDDITIHYKSLINSKPRFELDDRGRGFYKIIISETDNSLFFVIPIPPESYLGTFLAFLFIAMFIGFVSAIKLIEGKIQSIIGLIGSIIVLGFLSYSFYQKVIPTDFNKDLDMISLIGGGLGLSIGILLNSAYNLISINAIERQQSGQKNTAANK